MKDLNFLKKTTIVRQGIYDNERMFENTIPAFKRAIKYGFTIEIDVRLLACGTIIAYHDKNLNRLLHVDQETDKLDYNELSYMSKFQIPKLEEVLKLINASIPIIINLKTETRKYLLEKKLVEILDNYKGLFTIESSNKRTIKWFHKNKPEYIIGYSINKENKGSELFFKKYDYLNINAFIYKDKYIRNLREKNLIIGNAIHSKKEYLAKKDVYDSLMLDNALEIID